VAAVVGTCLVAVNQSATLFGGPRTALLWVRVGLDYVVPLIVANLGVLSAVRPRGGEEPVEAAGPAPPPTARAAPARSSWSRDE
jgi:hypothetical protein